jgi:hypothetical protein
MRAQNYFLILSYKKELTYISMQIKTEIKNKTLSFFYHSSLIKHNECMSEIFEKKYQRLISLYPTPHTKGNLSSF